MKKLTTLILIFMFFLSCDPVAQMEASIENSTSHNLSVSFISSDTTLNPNKLLQIASGQNVLFQEGFDIGSTFLEPSLIEYDSVIIRNQEEKVLKVFKENDIGKTIYGIDNYWLSSEPSKRFFKYEYKIEHLDIE